MEPNNINSNKNASFGDPSGGHHQTTLADVEEELRCSLCLELFTDPRVLNCQHTFCTKCITEYQRQSDSPSRISCPICRHMTKVPNDKITLLPRNFYLGNIIEKLKANRDRASLPVDSPLVTGGDWSMADAMEVDQAGPNASAPVAENYLVWTRLFNVAPQQGPTSPSHDQAVPRGFESLFPGLNSDPSQTIPAEYQPSAPSFDDDTPYNNATIQTSQSSQSPFLSQSAGVSTAAVPLSYDLPPDSPAFLPSASAPPLNASQSVPTTAQPKPQPQPQSPVSPVATKPLQNGAIYQPALIDGSRVPGLFHTWLQSLWFAPTDLLFSATLCNVDYVMVPYWVFDLRVQTQFIAKVRLQKDDSMKESTLDGQQVRDYKNILCCAAPDEILPYKFLRQSDHDWDISFLEPESPVGALWRGIKSIFTASSSGDASKDSSKNSRPPENAATLNHISSSIAYSRQGEALVEALERRAIEQHLTQSASIRTILMNLKVNLALLAQNTKLVYLPAYFCTYSYQGEVYTFIVNGQNGKIYGDRPFNRIGKVLSLGKSGWDYLAAIFQREKK